MSGIMIGSTAGKLYLGDTLLTGGGGGTVPTFNGYLQRGTQNMFNTNVELETAGHNFEITVAFYITTFSRMPAYYTHINLFGSNGKWSNGIPALDFTPFEPSSSNLIVASCTDSAGIDPWTYTDAIDSQIIENSKNYLRFSYGAPEKVIALAHSTDGTSYTSIYSRDLSSGNGIAANWAQTVTFAGANNGNPSPQNDDFHVLIEECKIVQDGVVLFGYD